MEREHLSGPQRLVYELLNHGVVPTPTETDVYWALKRARLVEPEARCPREDGWNRWERGSGRVLWWKDIVDGFAQRDGIFAKYLTCVDDRSGLCL